MISCRELGHGHPKNMFLSWLLGLETCHQWCELLLRCGIEGIEGLQTHDGDVWLEYSGNNFLISEKFDDLIKQAQVCRSNRNAIRVCRPASTRFAGHALVKFLS
jgi:hypothetical protein